MIIDQNLQMCNVLTATVKHKEQLGKGFQWFQVLHAFPVSLHEYEIVVPLPHFSQIHTFQYCKIKTYDYMSYCGTQILDKNWI